MEWDILPVESPPCSLSSAFFTVNFIVQNLIHSMKDMKADREDFSSGLKEIMYLS